MHGHTGGVSMLVLGIGGLLYNARTFSADDGQTWVILR